MTATKQPSICDNAFGEMLRNYRERAQLTLRDIANELNVSVPYLSDIERGVRAPFSYQRIKQVAGILDANEAKLVAAAEAHLLARWRRGRATE